MDRPLSGKRIVITRAPEDAGSLAALLADRGAELVFYPLLRIEPPADPAPLDAALDRIRDFGLLVCTSRNGVLRCCARARERGLAWRDLPPVVAIGAGTAQAAHEQALHVALVPEHADGPGLVAAMAARDTREAVLLPQAHNARPLVARGLEDAGYPVTAVEAYRGEPATPGPLPEPASLDAVTFASAATVERFISAAGDAAWRRLRADGCALVAIGPQTAAAIQQHDGLVAAEAAEPTMEALADAVILAVIG